MGVTTSTAAECRGALEPEALKEYLRGHERPIPRF
jgi:hypothetical protein